MDGIEQRRDVRYFIKVAAEVYTGPEVIQASTRDLSGSGICLDTDNALNEGRTVGISIFLTMEGIEDPDTEPINLKAYVIWCSERDNGGYSAGCRFEDIQPENLEALTQFLQAVGED